MADFSEGLDQRLRSSLASGHEAPRTLAERAFAALHHAIQRGELRPGERLPIEDVASALGMSPMPVREALRRLDADGLVEHIPHRGARVTELSIADLTEIYEARLALEPLAVRRAAELATDEQLVPASGALEEVRRLGGRGDRAWEAHAEFHFALYRGCGSNWLERLIQPLWESSERYRRAFAHKGRIDPRIEEHTEILEAVLARRPARAAALMHNHLATTANQLAGEMGGEAVFRLQRVPQGARAATGA